MWMKLLISYMETLSGPVEMINVYQPDPWDISLLGHTVFSIPLCFFPKIIGLFQRRACKGLIHIFVHFFVGIWGILCKGTVLGCMVNIVKFHWGVGAPAPHKRSGLGSVIGCIPAYTFNGYLDTKFFQLVGCIRCQRLTDRVACRIH